MANPNIDKQMIMVAAYFFFVFFILATMITASKTYDLDSSDYDHIDSDSKIYTQLNPINEGCSGNIDEISLEYCSEIIIAQSDNYSCLAISDCEYTDNALWWDECRGEVDITEDSCEDMNESYCKIYSKNGCDWVDAVDRIEDKMTIRSSVNTFGDMFAFFIGRNTNLGIGFGMQIMISILFFYLPGVYGVYLAWLVIKDSFLSL